LKTTNRLNSHVMIQSADRPEIEFKVDDNVKDTVGFGKICGFYDVTANFDLAFRAVG